MTTIFQNRNSAELEGNRRLTQSVETHFVCPNVKPLERLGFQKGWNFHFIQKVHHDGLSGKYLKYQSAPLENCLSIFQHQKEITHSCYLPTVNHSLFLFKVVVLWGFFLNAMEFEGRHEAISSEIACSLPCVSVFMHRESKVHHPVSIPYPASPGKRKRSTGVSLQPQMTDTTATPSTHKDPLKPWGSGESINHLGLFQQRYWKIRSFGEEEDPGKSERQDNCLGKKKKKDWEKNAYFTV